MNEELTEQDQAAAIRDLEAALEQTREAAAAKASELRAVAESKLADLEGRIKSASAELGTLTQRIREASGS